MKKFSDFAETNALEGERMKIDDVLGKDIIISGIRIGKSKYNRNSTGKYLTIQYKFKDGDKLYISFTGSDVLISLSEKHIKQIPFETKIIKIDRYYTFS